MLYLCYLCLFVYSGVQHILCCVFVSLPLVYPMLPVSLDCPLLIAPSGVTFGGSDLWWEWPLVGVAFGGNGLLLL
jgi:hypothetical protein